MQILFVGRSFLIFLIYSHLSLYTLVYILLLENQISGTFPSCIQIIMLRSSGIFLQQHESVVICMILTKIFYNLISP